MKSCIPSHSLSHQYVEFQIKDEPRGATFPDGEKIRPFPAAYRACSMSSKSNICEARCLTALITFTFSPSHTRTPLLPKILPV